jgi:hypothetical protein
VIVLPFRGVHLQAAVSDVGVEPDFQRFWLRVMLVVALPGARLAEWFRADSTGPALKESVIKTLCGLSDGLANGGFRVSTEILLVRLRRGMSRLPEYISVNPPSFFARHPFRFGSHCASPVLPIFGAPTARATLENVSVMQQPIQHGGDGGTVAQQLSPVI